MNTVDEYLAALPETERAVLAKLRKQIRAAAPDAEEKISADRGERSGGVTDH